MKPPKVSELVFKPFGYVICIFKNMFKQFLLSYVFEKTFNYFNLVKTLGLRKMKVKFFELVSKPLSFCIYLQ